MALDGTTLRFLGDQYSTDVISNRSTEFLQNALSANKPFFLGIAPIGPHSTLLETTMDFSAPISAKRHENLFPDAIVPRTPNFNLANVSNVQDNLHTKPLYTDCVGPKARRGELHEKFAAAIRQSNHLL